MNIKQINFNIADKTLGLNKRPKNSSFLIEFKRKKICKNPNILTGVELGQELFNKIDLSQSIIKKYAPDATILTIDDNVKDNIGNTDACLIYNRDKNTFEPINIKIYCAKVPKIKSTLKKLAYAITLAHEFTHYMQFKSKENIDFNKELSNNDFRYLSFLMPIGDGVFDEFDGMKFPFTYNIFNFFDKLTEKIYSFPIPRVKSFNKADILASGGFRTNQEFNKYISEEFDNIFNRTIEIILYEEGCASKSVKDFVEEIISDKNKLKKFKKDIKKYCAYKAKTEYEAYKTESVLTKKILKTDKRLNIDSYIMYYLMLENALK